MAHFLIWRATPLSRRGPQRGGMERQLLTGEDARATRGTAVPAVWVTQVAG
ncbi:MAG: hypothetical protein KatS3mg110_3765 [Pirellulaceae bacterium]|nr:MAG: hypothetical protein KatS3mg110_3765 [Pirellulaceae bacterium]